MLRTTDNLKEREKTIKVVGTHIYGNLKGCNREKLMDEKYLEEMILTAAKVGNMNVLDIKTWKIGLGVSVVAIILESHITLHTWPEFGFATVDVYSCGKHTDAKAAFDFIAKELEAEEIIYGEADRSLA